MSRVKKVCIIGGGVGGLVSLKNILRAKEGNYTNTEVELEPILFEKSDRIGGVWVYRGEDSDYENAMYSGLRANMPKETSFFLDFGPENYTGTGSFLPHSEILKYLEKYADVFNLHPYIKLNKEIKWVKRTPEGKWQVRIVPYVPGISENGEIGGEELLFDSVIVCNGHYNKPKLPEELYKKAQDNFKGKILHSFHYKRPEIYKGQRVVIIGGGFSGIDISIEISKYAEKAFLSLKDMEVSRYGGLDSFDNILQVPEVSSILENSVILEDGQEIICDAIIFATGYKYEFPFLEPDLISISEDGRKVTPLFRHLIHREYPTLAFVGLPSVATFFILNDIQARYYAKYLQEVVTLPNEDEIEAEIQAESKEREDLGFDPKKPHLFHSLQWNYCRKLASDANFKCPVSQILPQVENIYNFMLERIISDPVNYRNEPFLEQVQKQINLSCGGGRKTFC